MNRPNVIYYCNFYFLYFLSIALRNHVTGAPIAQRDHCWFQYELEYRNEKYADAISS